MPDAHARHALDQPLRTAVRAAIERAWERAMESGAAAGPARRRAAADRHRTAREPGSRRHREQPRPEARQTVSPGPAPDRAGTRGSDRRRAGSGHHRARCSAAAEAAAPGFLNLRIADAALEAIVERILADPSTWGRIAAGRPMRVDVEFVSANPDRAAAHRQRARRVRRRSAVPGSRGRRQPRRRASTTSTISGARSRSWARRFARSGWAGPSPRTATAATTSHDLARELPEEVLGVDDDETADWVGRPLGVGADPGGDRGQPGASRRALRRLEDRELTPRRGLGRASGGPAPRIRHGLRGRTVRPGSARRISATTRIA